MMVVEILEAPTQPNAHAVTDQPLMMEIHARTYLKVCYRWHINSKMVLHQVTYICNHHKTFRYIYKTNAKGIYFKMGQILHQKQNLAYTYIKIYFILSESYSQYGCSCFKSYVADRVSFYLLNKLSYRRAAKRPQKYTLGSKFNSREYFQYIVSRELSFLI